MSLFISAPIFLGVIVFAYEIITIFFGAKWLPSLPLLRILPLTGIIYSVTFFHDSIIISIGKPGYRLWLGVIYAVGGGILLFVSVQWGIVAVAVSFVLSKYIFSPISFYYLKRFIQISYQECLSLYFKPIATTLITYLIVFIIKLLLSKHIDIKIYSCICIILAIVLYFLINYLLFKNMTLKFYNFIKEVAPEFNRKFKRQ